MSYRVSVDTGGTFTDVVVADEQGRMTVGKALSTPDQIFAGLRAALETVANELGIELPELLRETNLLIYGTTHATNAIVTGNVAKTAFLTTEGFPDILVLKEGGKHDPHNFLQSFPEPYIPRRHTFEIAERVSSEGDIVIPLDEEHARRVLAALKRQNFEAIAVCFLWSIANPANELAMGALIERQLPGVPYTLSHKLLPIVREYRRASTTAIDASLKPVMQRHLREVEQGLRNAGYQGELLVSTMIGGCSYVEDLIEHPVYTVKSGPAMAPIAGATYARIEGLGSDVIVCDAGGTTFDVGLVREGRLKFTRETWLGPQWTGHIVGISSVDVRSVGAGGGSIAWVDSGGLLRVGPQSAGAMPGPACYGRGGNKPTVTDAALVLGFLDPDFFLGGRIKLDVGASNAVISRLGEQINQSPKQAAFSILCLANELMIRAIHEITVAEGFNPRESALVAGGGAAGLTIMPIASELGCRRIVLPRTAGALSACGMHFSDIVTERTASKVTQSTDFDFAGVNAVLDRIDEQLAAFRRALEKRGLKEFKKELMVEARYAAQVWELDTPLPCERFNQPDDVKALVEAFHEVHERVFAVRDPRSTLECINWKGRITARLESPFAQTDAGQEQAPSEPFEMRDVYFGGESGVPTPIYRGASLPRGSRIPGPAIIEEPTTTIVVYPGMVARVSGADNYLLEL
ncbi:MAG: hydantoinase/oxoprolinase family protein [Nitrospiraceae bacterium]|nr:hydantoinase/oxoprolinase family protein [Nitrospiraceae bacterium]